MQAEGLPEQNPGCYPGVDILPHISRLKACQKNQPDTKKINNSWKNLSFILLSALQADIEGVVFAQGCALGFVL